MELRCHRKVSYATMAAALSALKVHNDQAKEKGWLPLTHPYCCQYCNLWHNTSLPAAYARSHTEFHKKNVEEGRIGVPKKKKRTRK